MATILHIETATEVCSVALSIDNKLLMERVSDVDQSHSMLLGVFVEDIMVEIRKEDIQLDAVSVSSGPGSYTGLRIGVSQAKGLSYGLDIPLIAIPTPLVMAAQLQHEASENSLLCPMIDARRMEVYATFLDQNLKVVRQTSADIIEDNSYIDLLEKYEIIFFGNGADKCKKVIKHPNARFIDGITPLASSMVTVANGAFAQNRFEDVAYFEPFYLKEFVATVPKNKVLNI